MMYPNRKCTNTPYSAAESIFMIVNLMEELNVQRNLKDLSLEELVAVADRVKTNTIAVLRLFVTPHESHEGNYDFYVFYDNITELI